FGIAVDSAGNAFVTGETNSSDFPTTATATYGGGSWDAFVTKLDAAGSALVYSTYLGGSGSDAGHAIAVDASADAYVTGFTASGDFPATAGSFQATPAGVSDGFFTIADAFVAKITDVVPPPPPDDQCPPLGVCLPPVVCLPLGVCLPQWPFQ
ncbi:MAG: hypothetical protein E6H44_12400, partial [Betaproteobacteria bacterium]